MHTSTLKTFDTQATTYTCNYTDTQTKQPHIRVIIQKPKHLPTQPNPHPSPPHRYTRTHLLTPPPPPPHTHTHTYSLRGVSLRCYPQLLLLRTSDFLLLLYA